MYLSENDFMSKCKMHVSYDTGYFGLYNCDSRIYNIRWRDGHIFDGKYLIVNLSSVQYHEL